MQLTSDCDELSRWNPEIQQHKLVSYWTTVGSCHGMSQWKQVFCTIQLSWWGMSKDTTSSSGDVLNHSFNIGCSVVGYGPDNWGLFFWGSRDCLLKQLGPQQFRCPSACC